VKQGSVVKYWPDHGGYQRQIIGKPIWPFCLGRWCNMSDFCLSVMVRNQCKRLRQLQESILPLHFHYFISYFFNLEINNRLISCFKFKYFDFDSIKICNVYMFAKEESNHKIEGSAVNYSMLKNKLG
jgi:hypothetical protein